MKYFIALLLSIFSMCSLTGQLSFIFPELNCEIVNESLVCPPIAVIANVPPGANNLIGGDSVTGPGHKMFWHGAKCAVRAGILSTGSGTYWDEDSLGTASASFGRDTRASGDQSFATGLRTWASGDQSVAMGLQNEAHGTAAISLGFNSRSEGNRSIVLGQSALASGDDAIALGDDSNAIGQSAISIGEEITASGTNSMVIGTGDSGSVGRRLENNIPNSLMIGFKSTIPSIFVGPAGGPFQIGKVGIGNSNPQQLLDVSGAIKIGDTSTSAEGSIRYSGGKFEGHTSSGWVDFESCGGASMAVFSQSNNVAYYTAGNVGIGTTTPNTELEVNGDVTITGSIVGPSDQRLKTDIEDMVGGLEIIKALLPKMYQYRSDTDFNLPEKTQFGLIAQDVKKVLPSIVVKKALADNDGEEYQGLVYQQLIPILVDAIQEMDEKNEVMRDKIDQRITSIQAKLREQ